ncbi:hypothetical protein DDE74_38645 [Streptomyces lydicus]|uniref:PepSY domain-containing protein n=1 Tax=Streptomyces lydicus TaxID=47763 RepID=A0A3S9YLS1_9ACTN|nr:PepSY domain-containing protein [Streptomyces lydicus]AZS76006.1 hypothetical protein DDE74_38645 [Streptomyces lydicus]
MSTTQRLASSDSPGSSDPTRSGEDRAVRRTGWAALRPLVLRLHFYAGVLIAPFLLVAAVTGLLRVRRGEHRRPPGGPGTGHPDRLDGRGRERCRT